MQVYVLHGIFPHTLRCAMHRLKYTSLRFGTPKYQRMTWTASDFQQILDIVKFWWLHGFQNKLVNGQDLLFSPVR